jgi:large subunit ribosomal protein L5
VVPKLMQEVRYQNVMQVPRLTKITLNMGVGEAVANKKVLSNAVRRHGEDHRPEADRDQGARRSRPSSSATVADRLQGHAARRRMYEFLDRLVTSRCRASATSAACRVAPSMAAATTTGRQGTDHFPGDPLRPDRPLRGMDITITTTARTNEEGRRRCWKPSASRSATDTHRGKTEMAKTSMVNRESSAAQTVKKYAAKRAELKELIRSPRPRRRSAPRRR